MSLIKQAFLVVSISCLIAYLYGISFKKSSIVTERLNQEYDYIIVGGGAAGSVLASRLSEDKDNRVLLLEAGWHFDADPIFLKLSNFFDILQTKYDWGFYTEPQDFSNYGMNEKRSYWPRGRALGGSASINAAQYTRGSRFDFDEWADNGCTGWSYNHVLPYFLKSEDVQIDDLKASKYHSTGGPIAVGGGRVTALADLYMQAGRELGYKITDYNGEYQEGVNYIQVTTRNGARSNAGVEYLQHTATRADLHIAINSHVTKVHIQNQEARGVYVIRNGRKTLILARKEVILSAGAIQSPQILMLSGIGPKEHLAEFGIEAIVDHPVGQNLQDHQFVLMNTKINSPISITDNLKNSLLTKLKFNLFGQGAFTVSGADSSAFLYLDEAYRGRKSVDVQVVFFSTLVNDNKFNYRDDLNTEYFSEDGNSEGICTILLHTRPRFRGEIKLKSRDPFDYPSMNPKYFTHQEDVTEMIGAIRIWEKIMTTPTFKSLGVKIDDAKISLCSGHTFQSDAYWECFVRHIATTSYHPCCTVKMGPASSNMSVVDPELKVKGIKRLRVVDTSVFPNVTVGNTQAPTIMVAERAADMIRGIDTVKEFRRKLGL